MKAIRILLVLGILGFVVFNVVPLAAEEFSASGHGEATVRPVSKKKSDIEAARRKAQEQARDAAVLDAVTQALYKASDRSTLREELQRAARDAALHRADFTVGSETVLAVRDDGDTSMIDVQFRIDAAKLRRYLIDIDQTSSPQNIEEHRIYVLAYTIESFDPVRGMPVSTKIISTHDSVSSLNEQHDILSDRQNITAVAGQGNQAAMAKESDSSARARAGATDDVFGTSVGGSAAANNSQRSSASASSTQVAAGSASRDQYSNSGALNKYAENHDLYVRIIDYPDPNKAGATVTNEVRAKLEEAFHNGGLSVAFYPMSLQGREFPTEDDLSREVLENTQRDPRIEDNDYVVIALNKLTHLPGGHDYASDVTYRVVRKGDLYELLPSKNVRGESSAQSADDMGRSVATEVAVARAASTLPLEIKDASARLGRDANRASAVTTYEIDIDEIDSPSLSNALKDDLTRRHISFQESYRHPSRSERLVISLGGESVTDINSVIDAHVDEFEITSRDVRKAILTKAH
jgi:hypothetical protein